MALILHIETASPVCSTALSVDGKLLDFRETNDPKSHASRLSPYIEDLMSANKIIFDDVDAVAISLGPGSYTGLRIGVSTAKGIAYGAGLPIIGISTLQSLANRFIIENLNDSGADKNDLLCPMIDARRMEVYSAFYTQDLKQKREIKADIIDPDSYKEYLDSTRVFFFGDGSQKCKDIIKNPNATFFPDIEPSSRFMIQFF